MNAYRKLQVLLTAHNDVHAAFCAAYQVLLCIVTVMMLYGSVVGHHVLHPIVYILFPGSATFAILIQTAFFAQLSLWEIKSNKFLELLRRNVVSGGYKVGYKFMKRQLNMLVPLRCKLGCFTTFSLDMSHECMGVSFTLLLLLLN